MRRLVIMAAVAWLAWGAVARAEVAVYTPGGMTGALEDVAAAAAKAGLAVKVVSGHSPAQARQIVAGAPADIFISADPRWMAFLRGKRLVAEGSEAPLAATRLVLIAPAGSTLAYSARSGESLAAALGEGEGRLAICDPDTIPAGRFARAALEKLGAWQGLAERLALLSDVRQVAIMVGRGEVPAGIGFASDVAGDRTIRVVTEFPPDAAPPIAFPIAIVAGHDTAEVRKVYDFIRGPQGMAVLRAHGFLPPVQ